MFLTLILYIVGCSEDTTTAPPAPPINSSVEMAKLSDIQIKIFTNTCAVANCHASSSNQGNLTLTSGQSFSNLVNVQSVLFPQYKRVQPGNGGNSLLIKILKGEVSLRMPLSGSPLSNDVIYSIEAWINLGHLIIKKYFKKKETLI